MSDYSRNAFILKRACLGLFILAALLGLPASGWAQPIVGWVQVPVVVNDSLGPVASAEVKIWEIGAYWNTHTFVTGASGSVDAKFPLYDGTANPDNPKPNIGIFVLPGKNRPTYAYQKRILTFLFMGTEQNPGIRPETETFTISEGKALKVTVVSKAAGASATSPVSFPEAGGQLSVYDDFPGSFLNLSFTGATATFYLPATATGNVWANGDSNAWNIDKPTGYIGQSQSFDLTNAVDEFNLSIEITQLNKSKLIGMLTNASGPVTISVGDGYYVRYNSPSSSTYAMFVPPGTYDVRYGCDERAEMFYPGLVIGTPGNPATVAQDVTFGPGYVLNGTMKTVDNIVPNGSGINFWKGIVGPTDTRWIYMSAVSIENTNGSFTYMAYSNGVYKPLRLAPGLYKYSTYHNHYNGYLHPDYTNPTAAYKHLVDIQFNIVSSDANLAIVLPKAGLLKVRVTNGANEYLPPPGNFLRAKFSTLREMVGTGTIYPWQTDCYPNASGTVYTIPFLPGNEHLVGIVEEVKPASGTLGADEVFQHFVKPDFFPAHPDGQTTNMDVVFDKTNFCNLIGNVYLPGTPPHKVTESGRVFFGPKYLLGTAPIDPWDVAWGFFNAQEQGLRDNTADPQYLFKVEKGYNYFLRLEQTERIGVGGLEDSGFTLTETNVTIPATATLAFRYDLIAKTGAGIIGNVTVNGVLAIKTPPALPWRLVVRPWDQPWNTRILDIPSGTFRVSGLTVGSYTMELDDNPSINPENWEFPGRYPTQFRPKFIRQASITDPSQYVNQDIALSTVNMGGFFGNVVDDSGNPIPDALFEVRDASGSIAFSLVSANGKVASDAGKFVLPAPASNPTYIPLEAATYTLQLVKFATDPAVIYEIPEPLPLSIIPGKYIKIQFVLKRRILTKFALTKDGQPGMYMGFQIINSKGESVRWAYTDYQGNSVVDKLDPGTYTMVLQNYGYGNGSISEVYFENFFVPPTGDQITINKSFSSANLKTWQVMARKLGADQTPLTDIYFNMKRVLDPTTTDSPFYYFSSGNTYNGGSYTVRLTPGTYIAEPLYVPYSSSGELLPGDPIIRNLTTNASDTLYWKSPVTYNISFANPALTVTQYYTNYQYSGIMYDLDKVANATPSTEGYSYIPYDAQVYGMATDTGIIFGTNGNKLIPGRRMLYVIFDNTNYSNRPVYISDPFVLADTNTNIQFTVPTDNQLAGMEISLTESTSREPLGGGINLEFTFDASTTAGLIGVQAGYANVDPPHFPIDTGTFTGINTGTFTGSGSGTGTGINTGTGTGSGSGTGTGINTGTFTGSGSGTGTGINTGTFTGTGTFIGTGTFTGTGTFIGSGSGTITGTGTGTGVHASRLVSIRLGVVLPSTSLVGSVAKLRLPARAYRVRGYAYGSMTASHPMPVQYTPVVMEDVVIRAGATTTVNINFDPMSSLSGNFGPASFGYLQLYPKGVDRDMMTSSQYGSAANGKYSIFANPGNYFGFAQEQQDYDASGPVPTSYAPTFFEATILRGDNTGPDITLKKGVNITGFVLARDGAVSLNSAGGGTGPALSKFFSTVATPSGTADLLPVPNAYIQVFRKFSARSDLYDGQQLYYYPVYNANSGATGSYMITVEPNVDYYLLANAPNICTALYPIHVGVNTGDVTQDIVLSTNGQTFIDGTLNNKAQAWIEARPLNLGTQFGAAAQPVKVETDLSGAFRLEGLSSVEAYQLIITPKDVTKAVQIIGPARPGTTWDGIDLEDGYAVRGQLVDANGAAVPVASVSVKLRLEYADTSFEFLRLTDKNGNFEFRQMPSRDNAVLQTIAGVKFGDNVYGLTNVSFSILATDTVQNLALAGSGGIKGRIVDGDGAPIANAKIRLVDTERAFEGTASATGDFLINFVPPAPDYALDVTVTGRPPFRKTNIQIVSGNILDLGPITLNESNSVVGRIRNFQKAILKMIPDGLAQINAFLFNHDSTYDERGHLTDDLFADVTGVGPLSWDLASPPTEIKFNADVNPGLNDLVFILERTYKTGALSRVFFGWQPNAKSTASDTTFDENWGSASGSVVFEKFGEASETLKLGDGVVLFYPYPRIPGNPLPVAVAQPYDGIWQIERIPYGTYHVVIISNKYPRFETLASEPIVISSASPSVYLKLLLTTRPAQISGKVVDPQGAPLADVKAVMNELVTRSDKDGKYLFFIPPGNTEFAANVLLSMPGYASKRVVASWPRMLATEPRDLLVATLSADVAKKLSGVIVNASGSLPISGAKVRIGFQEKNASDSPLIRIGDTTTDNAGAYSFTSVPAGKVLQFLVNAEGFLPLATSVPALTIGAEQTFDQVLTVADSLKAFILTASMNASGTITARIKLDRQVATSTNPVTVEIGQGDPASLTTVLQFTDEIRGMASMMLVTANGVATKTVTILIKQGNTVIVNRTIDARRVVTETAVDPLAAGGFTQRLTEDQGNKYVGIQIPEGYLPAGVSSFSLTQVATTAAATVEDSSGQSKASAFDGPIYEFNFGMDIGTGTQATATGTTVDSANYLFDVTLKYTSTDTSKLEPRWYNPARQSWSKVGIQNSTIQWDTPDKGYVTFKVSHLSSYAVVSAAPTRKRFDIDGDGTFTADDVILTLAWIQTRRSTDQTKILARAQELLSTVKGPAAYVPSNTDEDLTSNGMCDVNDVVLALAYIQARRSTDAAKVQARAVEILSTMNETLTRFPEEPVTISSSVK
ncbi:MAG: carboxypeptidase regulatory-like domain-containing protein [Candidatus Riflebacteria bacterium]|nr:carboxypeptidase regulatory-like domain-containing protein [Candidatus Riflebacteria bacterium]